MIIPGIQRDGYPEPENPPSFRDYVRKQQQEMADPTEDQLALRRWVDDGGYEKKPLMTFDPDEAEFPEADIPEV